MGEGDQQSENEGTGSNLETVTNRFYDQLSGISKELFDRLEQLTEPNAAYFAVKPKILDSSKALRAVYDTKEEDDEIEITNKFQAAAKTYLEAAGMKFENDVLYASQMKRMLDKNYGKVREAIKIGDIDELAVLFKNAWTSENWAAEVEDTGERIKHLLSPDKVAFSQACAEIMKGANYAKVLEDLQGYIQKRMETKANLNPYK